MEDRGLFDDRSMMRRVHREWAVALAGPRALLMQATHPVAFAGFFAHTGALDEPYERLNRTAAVMDEIALRSPPRRADDRAGTGDALAGARDAPERRGPLPRRHAVRR